MSDILEARPKNESTHPRTFKIYNQDEANNAALSKVLSPNPPFTLGAAATIRITQSGLRRMAFYIQHDPILRELFRRVTVNPGVPIDDLVHPEELVRAAVHRGTPRTEKVIPGVIQGQIEDKRNR